MVIGHFLDLHLDGTQMSHSGVPQRLKRRLTTIGSTIQFKDMFNL